MSDHLHIFGPKQDINIDKVKGGGKANFPPAHKKTTHTKLPGAHGRKNDVSRTTGVQRGTPQA